MAHEVNADISSSTGRFGQTMSQVASLLEAMQLIERVTGHHPLEES